MENQKLPSLNVVALAVAIALGSGVTAAWAQSETTEETDTGSATQSSAVPQPAFQQPAPIEEIIAVGRSLSTAEELITERMDESVAIDVLGADAIGRLGDSTVAAALKRVPGLTLVGGKFVYIRGLGERYSASYLNGSRVPSPDLTRNVLPLDIFPTSVVESIRIQKAYSPDQPANFGGGSVDVRTRGIPDSFTAQFEIGSGYNTQVGSNILSYPGSGDDSRGQDGGLRQFPQELGSAIQRFQGDLNVQNILSTLQADNPSLSNADALTQAQQINRDLGIALNRDIGVESESTHPDIGVKAAIGNSIDLGSDWTFGFLAGASYNTDWRETDALSRNFQFPTERTDRELESTRNISLSGNLNFGVRFLDDHEINTTTLFLRNTDDETAVTDFFNENREVSDGIGFRNTRFQFEERNMVVNQISGTHYLGEDTRDRLPEGVTNLFGWVPEETEFTWFYSESTARTDIPNQVEISSQTVTDPVSGATISSAVALDATAADYRFTDLDDDVETYGWGVKYPLDFESSRVELGFGYSYDQKVRTYQQSQFSLGALSVSDPGLLGGGLDDVFSDSNISDPNNNFVFNIQGTNNQSYIAATQTNAMYGMVDWTLDETWRIVAGARWEDYKQVAVDWNPFGFSETNPQVTTDPEILERGAFQRDDVFPAFAVTYMTDWWAETFQLRFGYSETAVRPDLREITDASYVDPRTGDLVDGNPGVVPSEIKNYDIRGEWFFSGGDNLTLTLYYKDVLNPIEFFESAASDTTTAREIINAESAEVFGLEVEGLKELSFLGDAFSSFYVQGNATFQDSELVAGEQADAPTNPVRELTSASDYVLNLSVGYDSQDGKHTATVGYNVFGERLYVAGRNGAPDGFEQPFHSLDVVYSWYPTDTITVKAKLQNVLQETIEIEREGVTTFEEDPGSTFGISFQWFLQ